MGIERIAEISPRVREVLEAPSDGMCATFEIVGKPDSWVQVMKGTINAAYPLDVAPAKHLMEILAYWPGSAVTDWEAKKFVTLAFESTDPRDIAKAVDRLLARLFGAGDYAIDCSLQDL